MSIWFLCKSTSIFKPWNFLKLDIRAVFLNIFKEFDKISFSCLMFKSKSFRISGDLLKLTKNFLSNRFQRVVVNRQTSELDKINAGVPQRSFLGRLFFLIYINELSDEISFLVKLFCWWDITFFQLVKIRMIQHHSLKMILTKLVIELIHGKCLLTITCPSAPVKCSLVASPVNKFAKITSSVPNYTSPPKNKYFFLPQS